MGKSFGELGVVIRGIVYYKLSPHEQKPFAGMISQGLPNVLPRTLQTVVTWLPTFLITWFVYVGVEKSYLSSKRKNLRDYANEVAPAVVEEETPKDEDKPAKKGKCKTKKEKAEDADTDKK